MGLVKGDNYLDKHRRPSASEVRCTNLILIKAPSRKQGIITAVKNQYPRRKPYEILYKTPSILLRH